MRILMVMMMLTAVSLAGCADDGGEDENDTETQTPSPTETGTDTGTGTESQTTTTTSSSPAPKRDPVTWDVEVRDNSFSPADLTVQVGDTVRWSRIGSNPHTVTADDDSFHSGDCPGADCFHPAFRQEFEITFDTVAEIGYYCEIHGGPGGSGMSGVVAVLERYDETPSS